MQVNNSINQIKDLIERSNKILLVTREHPTLDGLYSTLALNFYLSKIGKEVRMVSGDVSNFEIPNKELFTSSIPPRNLVISFDYVDGSIEKVSYSTEGNKFNLVITPRASSLNPESINYSYSGDTPDLVFVVDVPELPLIAQSALSIQTDFPATPLVNIDHTQINSLYGQLNYVDVGVASTSEIVMEMLTDLNAFDQESAKFIYQGIKSATQSFSVGVTSETLESAATVMRVIEGKEEPKPLKEPENNSPKETPTSVTPDSSWFSPKIFKSSQVN